MIVIVSAIIPPDHTGAGKRMYGFFEYLSNQGEDVLLLTYTKRKGRNIKVLKTIPFLRKFRKIEQPIHFFYSLLQLFFNIGFFKIKDRASTNTVWLTSTGSITFSSALFFKILRYKIITQNTLVGSDDPQHKYKNDFFGFKYLLKMYQYRLSDAVTSISPRLYEISKMHHHNCSMIPNPVSDLYNDNFIDRSESSITNILIVGALCKRKGTDIVFRTIELLLEKYPFLTFTFVGPDNQMERDLYLKFLDIKSHFRNSVFFQDFIENPLPFFVKADLFFLPSRREGFGTVFIEAMANGLPIIAKKIEGITDYIFENEYETIIDSENPECFFTAFEYLFEHAFHKDRLINIGVKSVNRFQKICIYNDYINLIRK